MYRSQLTRGNYPYLPALDDIVSFAGISSEADLGLMEISLDAVAGTRTAGRQRAFAGNFMPLLDDNTEFACKWSSLYDAHMEEGIRDPVKAVEFMNRYYIVEGNKRVSVLKYVDAASVQAHVTRLIPQRNDSPENRIYYEFLDFYKYTSIDYLTFSQEGCYSRLLTVLGKMPDEPWTSEEKINFRSDYLRFLNIFESEGGRRLSLTPGDAFLIYLEIYGNNRIQEKSQKELQEELQTLWKDFEFYPARRNVELLTSPEQTPENRTLINRILPRSASPVKIAFIHERTPEESSWTYGHELGRHYLDDVMEGQVVTSSYTISSGNSNTGLEVIKSALEDGNTILFTTSPRLLNASVQAALKYPSARILNCSMNSSFGHLRTYYGRMYEAKYLTGLLAGILSPDPAIGYVADLPIYGSTASINAFALGVRAVNPDASIYLEWSCIKNNRINDYFDARHISHVSGQDLLTPSRGSRQFGLYDIRGGQIQNIAMPVWHWGKFYERIVRSILNGGWKKGADQSGTTSINYFWGLSSGMIDIICSSHVPAATARLIDAVKHEIASGQFHPFSGQMLDQSGTLRNKDGSVMPEEQIGSMDWLLDNVHGDFPDYELMTEEAKQIVKLQGIQKYQPY